MNEGTHGVDLVGLCAALASELGDVKTSDARGATEYRRGGTAFATVTADGSSVELRLNPDVAEAARRTPAAAPSRRGREWVVFTPRALEGHDRDRAEAWFRSAWREAEARR